MKIATIITAMKIFTTKVLNVAGKCERNEDCVDEYPICKWGNCGKYFTRPILRKILPSYQYNCAHLYFLLYSNTVYF